MIRQRGSSYQVDLRHDGRRIRKSFTQKSDALRWEAEATDRLSKGLTVDEVVISPSGGWTMRKLMDSVEGRFWKGTPNGAESVRIGDKILEAIGEGTDPKNVTATVVDELVAEWMDDGNTGATINRKLSVLGKLLRYAVSRGIIDRVPHMERRTESQGRLRWFTKDEEERICAQLRADGEPEVADLVVFLMDTGGRLGEVLELQCQDVLGDFVQFNVTKNGRTRGVPKTTRVRALCDRLSAGRGHTEELWRVTERQARDSWNTARVKVGIADDEAVLHACRHTCASRLVQAGTPIQVVQQWLGHRTLTMTMRYAHMAPANMLTAVTALENLRA